MWSQWCLPEWRGSTVATCMYKQWLFILSVVLFQTIKCSIQSIEVDLEQPLMHSFYYR